MSIQNHSDDAHGVEPNQTPRSHNAGWIEPSESEADKDSPEQDGPLNSKTRNFQTRRALTKTKGPTRIQVALLATQVGYLEVEPLAHRYVLDAMPKQLFLPNEIIPCGDVVCVIERGSVSIRHARHKYPIKELGAGRVFGQMASMGQTMSASEAAAGVRGAAVTTVNAVEALQWVAADPRWWLSVLGARLAERETDLYRTVFGPPESRLAALMLKLAGGGSVIQMQTQEAMGDMIGLHRVIVSSAIRKMRDRGIVATRRRTIIILDKEALKEMSEP